MKTKLAIATGQIAKIDLMVIERAAPRKEFEGVGQKDTTTQIGTSASELCETSQRVKIELIWFVQKQ